MSFYEGLACSQCFTFGLAPFWFEEAKQSLQKKKSLNYKTSGLSLTCTFSLLNLNKVEGKHTLTGGAGLDTTLVIPLWDLSRYSQSNCGCSCSNSITEDKVLTGCSASAQQSHSNQQMKLVSPANHYISVSIQNSQQVVDLDPAENSFNLLKNLLKNGNIRVLITTPGPPERVRIMP